MKHNSHQKQLEIELWPFAIGKTLWWDWSILLIVG